MEVIMRICNALKCYVGNVMEMLPEEEEDGI